MPGTNGTCSPEAPDRPSLNCSTLLAEKRSMRSPSVNRAVGRQIAVDHRGEVRERRADQACADRCCGHARCWVQEAHVTELTGLLREGPGGDQLAAWPALLPDLTHPESDASPAPETIPAQMRVASSCCHSQGAGRYFAAVGASPAGK